MYDGAGVNGRIFSGKRQILFCRSLLHRTHALIQIGTNYSSNSGTSIYIFEAFPVYNGCTRLFTLLLADPHMLEGGQRGQDSLWLGNDLDLHRGWIKSSNLIR